MSDTFRSLKSFTFRLWTVGALVSNVGTWMQRVAQDWLVLTQLTHHDASALGIVMGLQFAPQLLFLPWTTLVQIAKGPYEAVRLAGDYAARTASRS